CRSRASRPTRTPRSRTADPGVRARVTAETTSLQVKQTATALVAAALAIGGCGVLDNPSPHRARLVIQGEAGKIVRVIISTEFVAQVNERGETSVVMFTADTLFTELPYERVYGIEE